MKYIITTEVSGVPYYVRIRGTVCEVRGLKDHATVFDVDGSAHFWRRRCEEQRNNLKFTVKPLENDKSATPN